MGAWASFALSVIPTLLKIIEQFVVWANEKKFMDAGKQEAIVEASKSLNSILSKAAAALQEAAERHVKDDTDGAFDREFMRKE